MRDVVYLMPGLVVVVVVVVVVRDEDGKNVLQKNINNRGPFIRILLCPKIVKKFSEIKVALTLVSVVFPYSCST